MKVVVCGPPHSGKSVFLGGLCENLPRDGRFLFRACPDGEGTWTWKGNGSESYRRKGTFSGEIVDWYARSLRECQMAPIVLVDIGGRTSEQNRRILTEGGVEAAIILAGDLVAVPEWEQFCQECGLEVLAVLHSHYHGTEDDIGSSPMVVHRLERGEDVSGRPAIQRVAELIMERTVPVAVREEKKMSLLSDEGILGIPCLAETLGKKTEARTLPNGRIVKQIVWVGEEDLVSVANLIHNGSSTLPEHVRIDGAAPAWLVVALAHEVHPRVASYNSPDGYIPIGCRRPEGEGSGPLSWTRTEIGQTATGRRLIKVEFQLDPSTPFAPAQLEEIVPPAVEMGDVVVLSGRGPHWLTASVAGAYHGRAAAVACFQPGSGATVAWTHVSDVGLGTILEVA